MPKPWGVFICQHVIPMEDKLVHKMAEDCICKPRVEDHPHKRGGWVVIHNALDRRANWAPEVILGGKLAD